MTRPHQRPHGEKIPLQSRLRELGHKLGLAELHGTYGDPTKVKAMKKLHADLLRKHYIGHK